MLTLMLCDPDLFNSVRTELDACCALDGSCDVDKLLTDCPHLDTIWNETLRLYNGATAVRKAVGECRIRGKVDHSGDQVFGPARNVHLVPSLFGRKPSNSTRSGFSRTRICLARGGSYPLVAVTCTVQDGTLRSGRSRCFWH